MPIKRHIFDVEYILDPVSGATTIYRTRVIMADRVATEGRGRRYGLLDSREQPQLTALLWLWFSSIREGHIPDDTTFEEFGNRCLENTVVEEVEVPPTQGSGDSSSPSPETSPPSPSTGGSPTTG